MLRRPSTGAGHDRTRQGDPGLVYGVNGGGILPARRGGYEPDGFLGRWPRRGPGPRPPSAPASSPTENQLQRGVLRPVPLIVPTRPVTSS